MSQHVSDISNSLTFSRYVLDLVSSIIRIHLNVEQIFICYHLTVYWLEDGD